MLIEAIVTASGTRYEALSLDPPDDTSGGNIRVAYLFNPARLTADAAALEEIDASAFGKSRLALVARCQTGGHEVVIVNVHLSSKGDSGSAYGIVQPTDDPSETARIDQVRAVRDYVRALPADEARTVVVLGDFNAFWYETPLLLTGCEPASRNLALDEPPRTVQLRVRGQFAVARSSACPARWSADGLAADAPRQFGAIRQQGQRP